MTEAQMRELFHARCHDLSIPVKDRQLSKFID